MEGGFFMPAGSGQFLYLIAVFGLFYFLLIRPQQKKNKALKQMRENLNVGDNVITIGGMVGKIVSIKDDEIEISVSGNNLKFMKWAISSLKE
jgi:preprotein translocase subunit YajC